MSNQMYANLQKKKIKKGVVSSGFTNISRSHNNQALLGYATKNAAIIATNQGFFLINDMSLSNVPIPKSNICHCKETKKT